MRARERRARVDEVEFRREQRSPRFEHIGKRTFAGCVRGLREVEGVLNLRQQRRFDESHLPLGGCDTYDCITNGLAQLTGNHGVARLGSVHALLLRIDGGR